MHSRRHPQRWRLISTFFSPQANLSAKTRCYFLKSESEVVVRNCGQVQAPVVDLSDCAAVGDENRIPYAVFKRDMSHEFDISEKVVDEGMSAPNFTHVTSIDRYWVRPILLAQFDASKPECGTDANVGGVQLTIQARIENCEDFQSFRTTSPAIVGVQGWSWDLVARKHDPSQGQILRAWQDGLSGNLWSDALDDIYTLDEAELGVDRGDSVVLAEIACVSVDGKRATAEITERSFGVLNGFDFDRQADIISWKNPCLAFNNFPARGMLWLTSPYNGQVFIGDTAMIFDKKHRVICVSRGPHHDWNP